MTVDEILIIMQNRLITLQETRKLAVASGNLEQIVSIDKDLSTTQLTIQQLSETQNT